MKGNLFISLCEYMKSFSQNPEFWEKKIELEGGRARNGK